MRKILTLILSLLVFCGCSRQITINFMVKDQIAFSVSGKSPIILNEQDFQIDDEIAPVSAGAFFVCQQYSLDLL